MIAFNVHLFYRRYCLLNWGADLDPRCRERLSPWPAGVPWRRRPFPGQEGAKEIARVQGACPPRPRGGFFNEPRHESGAVSKTDPSNEFLRPSACAYPIVNQAVRLKLLGFVPVWFRAFRRGRQHVVEVLAVLEVAGRLAGA